MRNLLFTIILFLFLPLSVQAQSGDFPGRTTYPNVGFYEIDKLAANFENVVIVDVRSNYEYETLHINTAINIPLVGKTFAEQIKALPAEGKDIIFYCNGHTCYKSYKAVLKAKSAGVNNTYTFDAGIFDWAKAHPDKSTLLGVSPIDPEKLISKDKFKQHLIEPKDFKAQITDDTVILDIREPAQRGLIELYPYRQENIAMGDKERLARLISKVLERGSPLMVYDEAGKQVAWLQYYLEAKGVKNYFFMKGGLKQYFKDLRKK